MKTQFILLIALAVGGSFPALADEQTRRVQEELRKRNLYFGEIDGQKTDETRQALRQYQQRKGFKVTGDADGDTLNALNLGPAAGNRARATASTAEQWPDVPVLKSDAARRMKEEDRKYLESLEPIAEPPVDEPMADSPEPNPPTINQRPPPVQGEEKREPANTRETKPLAKSPAAEAPQTGESAIPPEKIESLIRKYLEACETNRLSAETAYYADRLKYFDHGTVSRDFVERDVAAFYRRWPERDYELLDWKLLQSNPDEAVVRFRIAFRYRSPQHSASGKTDNVFTVRRTSDGMKFTAMREQRLRE
jgi:peptidoglycan hydrolase-like protein with peptidoglycan-binding domain